MSLQEIGILSRFTHPIQAVLAHLFKVCKDVLQDEYSRSLDIVEALGHRQVLL
jgi:hypothetical protein